MKRHNIPQLLLLHVMILARLEVRLVLEELSTRLPSLRLVPGQTLHYLPNVSFRGPRSLYAEWDA